MGYWGVLETDERLTDALEYFAVPDNRDDYERDPWIVFYSSSLVDSENSKVRALKTVLPNAIACCVGDYEDAPVYTYCPLINKALFIENDLLMVADWMLPNRDTTRYLKVDSLASFQPTNNIERFLQKLGYSFSDKPATITRLSEKSLQKIYDTIESRKDALLGIGRKVYMKNIPEIPAVKENKNAARAALTKADTLTEYSAVCSNATIFRQLEAVQNVVVPDYLEC